MSFVVKRDGKKEPISFDKILRRVGVLSRDLDHVDHVIVAQKVVSQLYSGVTTSRLDEFAAELCAQMVTTHPDYGKLASRLIVSNCQKNTPPTFRESMLLLQGNVDVHGAPYPLISDELFMIVKDHHEQIEKTIDYSRDFEFDYFGFKTMERAYLMRVDKVIVERPQHMIMRVALGIHGRDLARAFRTYDMISNRMFTHATPTLFNAGTRTPQLSSCFLATVKDDSIDGIYDTVKQTAKISKFAGGIGLSIHDIRANGSLIRGTNGYSTGIVPMLKVFNDTARHVNQSGKRFGSFAIFLEPWHADVFEWLDLRKNSGAEEHRARDLFYGLWTPDLFMERVRDDSDWSLFCPDECRGLSECHGDDFVALYRGYEEAGRAKRTVKARKLWEAVIRAQIETGTPYVCFKDQCNQKSNQKNLGTIKSSNLCVEIVEHSSPEETAVCNLASICLPAFVQAGSYNFELLHQTVKEVAFNLDRIIDRNFYPIPEAERSNLRHRPIGIGVQGIADVFMMLRLPFDSAEAAELNRSIFETIYHAALDQSCEIAEKRHARISGGDLSCCNEHDVKGSPRFLGAYSSFEGSPASEGILQFDMWGVEPSSRYDWASLKKRIAKFGLRNSQSVALMPTASTSQIMGYTECFEPLTSNIAQRKTIAGNFITVNKYLVDDLISLGLWNEDMKNRIVMGEGSIQNIAEIPDDVKAIYKTVWDISQRVVIDMAADRGAFVCQSQSMNLFVGVPEISRISNMLFYAWTRKLKTGSYYLRIKPPASADKFSIMEPSQPSAPACRRGDDGCIACGS